MRMRVQYASQFAVVILLLAPLSATAQEASQLDAAQSTARHRAVRSGPNVAPASATLIDKALADGKLDGETALSYQVYAAFADCRLPAEFRGDDSTVESSM